MLVSEIDKQVIRVYGEPVTITKETIQKTCHWYAENSKNCILQAFNGFAPVNDLGKYKEEKLVDIEKYLTGNFEAWLGFWQKALYLQTNKSVSIL